MGLHNGAFLHLYESGDAFMPPKDSVTIAVDLVGEVNLLGSSGVT